MLTSGNGRRFRTSCWKLDSFGKSMFYKIGMMKNLILVDFLNLTKTQVFITSDEKIISDINQEQPNKCLFFNYLCYLTKLTGNRKACSKNPHFLRI